MSTRVKVCGITNLDDARFCVSQGADYLGFIQVPGSPRYVDPARVREICDWLEGATTVGVFADATPDEITRAREVAGFDIVQLHGGEAADEYRRIGVPLIRSVAVPPSMSAEVIAETVRGVQDSCAFVLFDTSVDGRSGGTGRSFDWSLLSGIEPGLPFFVAGGLGPANVAEAIATARPYGVDASSKLESRPGVKDFELVEKFFAAVRLENTMQKES